MNNKALAIGVLVVGLAAVNLVYLSDLLAGSAVIQLGWKSAVGLIIANLVTVGGLVMLVRSGTDSQAR